MCGRYTIRRIDLLIRFGAMEAAEFEAFDQKRIVPRFNVAPSQFAPVVRLNAKGERVIDQVRWGLIPSWTKGKPKLQPVNARSETVATSGMFRQAFQRRRCLVPVDGFYEWKKVDEKNKQPMFIHRLDDEPFAFAGLWERWIPEPGAEPVDTFTILTTQANPMMSAIHDRMPVILREPDFARWLDRNVPGDAVADLLVPLEDTKGEFEAYRVSKHVNTPKNDDAHCVEREVDQ